MRIMALIFAAGILAGCQEISSGLDRATSLLTAASTAATNVAGAAADTRGRIDDRTKAALDAGCDGGDGEVSILDALLCDTAEPAS